MLEAQEWQVIESEIRERVAKAKKLAAANGISYVEGLLMEKRLRQAKFCAVGTASSYHHLDPVSPLQRATPISLRS